MSHQFRLYFIATRKIFAALMCALRSQVVIIGAGVVGLAVAERLTRRTSDVLVLEAEARAGRGVSARNSQVLHSGLYYPTDSLKARLCVAGNGSLARWCDAHRVPRRSVGKLLVASDGAEVGALEALALQAQANGVPGVEVLDGAAVRTLEPAVRAVAGLWVPSAGILDAAALVEALARVVTERGATLALRHHVTAMAFQGGSWMLDVQAGAERFRVEADLVVNAAGLHADTVASMAGLDVDALGYRQHWVKGRYARLRRRWAIAHLVYPVPPVALAGLGVHLTLGLDGDARLGPDVAPLAGRVEDYRVDEDFLPQCFEAARRSLPGLELGDLSPDMAGLRPKLAPVGGPWRDFVISEESRHGCPGLVTLAGIESPGLTSCLELASEVASRLALA